MFVNNLKNFKLETVKVTYVPYKGITWKKKNISTSIHDFTFVRIIIYRLRSPIIDSGMPFFLLFPDFRIFHQSSVNIEFDFLSFK